MPARRRTDPVAGAAALQAWRTDQQGSPRETLATAVRFTLESLAEKAPGHAIEVRVPPYGVVQCGPGPRHTRGTPPNVVEADPSTWLRLAIGELSWGEALASGSVRASGARADLASWLPVQPADPEPEPEH